MNSLFHTAHAHAMLDVTWVGYTPYISSYAGIGQLKEQLVLASNSLPGLWVSIFIVP